MKEILPYLQNAAAIAFVLLGIATGIGWLKRRDKSLGWLALAIVLLSAVSILGRVPALVHPEREEDVLLLLHSFAVSSFGTSRCSVASAMR